MSKLLALIFAGIVVSTRAAVVSPVKPLADLFKIGANPSGAATNAAVDESVGIAKTLLNNSVASLPNINDKFIDEHGHRITVKLTNGQFRGIDTLYREGDAKIIILKNVGRFVNLLGFKNLTITYNYKLKYRTLRREGKVRAEGSGFRSIIEFLTNRKTLKVSSYFIYTENTGPIDIKLEGNPKANIPIIENLIEKAVVTHILKVANDMLNNYNSSS